MVPRITLALAVGLALGCGDKNTEPAAGSAEADREAATAAAIAAENAAPPKPKAPPKPSKFEATVDLTLTGAIEQRFTGPVGICGATFIDGKLQGGNYGIRTDDLELQVIALTDAELRSPKVLLNVKGPARRSFVRRGDAGTVTIDVTQGATLDVELKAITGPETVKVTGTITCGPDYRAR